MHIETDDLSRPAVHALLREHLQNMIDITPAGSVHALDLEKLRHPDITFWTAWEGDVLLGCGALTSQGEIKSMRTPDAHRRRGAGRAILEHIIETARGRGYARLNLETGAQAAFQPAHKLYESFGFVKSGSFGDYANDANSVFMTLSL
jgi:putative acetyltransferase